MPSQNLTRTLAEHGLVKADTATESDWNAIDGLRSKFSQKLTWTDIQRILDDHSQARPYLYLSTGMDGLALLDVGTGETLDAKPLTFGPFAAGDDATGTLMGMYADMMERRLERWNDTASIASLIQLGETDDAKRRIRHATAIAPAALVELVYALMPWEELGDAQFQRRIALTVRKYEDYPSGRFDEGLVGLLKRTSPCVEGDEPLEMAIDGPITVYRGEIDGSVHMGLSWTTSLDVAERFAGRFGKRGSVLRTVLEPEGVLAAYADDGESEVLAVVPEGRVAEL